MVGAAWQQMLCLMRRAVMLPHVLLLLLLAHERTRVLPLPVAQTRDLQ